MTDEEIKQRFKTIDVLDNTKNIIQYEVKALLTYDPYKAGMLQVAWGILQQVTEKLELEVHSYLGEV
jgi:hypothetical protein